MNELNYTLAAEVEILARVLSTLPIQKVK